MSSSAAVSTLTRPRIAIALISVLTAASAGYYLYQYRVTQSEPAGVPGPGLHRSNAVRRQRQRRGAMQLDLDSEGEVVGEGDENAPSGILAPLIDVDGQNDDDWFNDALRPRTGENIVTLLFRVSEDNARRNSHVHRNCQCNGCGMVPIRGIRYRCANCTDFDLCEVCESQGLHNKTHIFYKVRIPAPPFCPRHVQPAWYAGDPDNALRALSKDALAKWCNETGFERVELEAYWEQWTFMANTEWRDDPDHLELAMDRKTFERCLVPLGGFRHASPNLIHDRMFAFYDTNKDDLIGFDEFLRGVSYRKRSDKLRRTFEGYDIDGDGFVNRRDFLRMFRAYYVLYKQMHRDILEGLDDHMMTTTEAQQLVNSRAPLSSLFGREGRVPHADHMRPLEGKVFHSNGEVEVHDDNGVVDEDKPDISSREDVLNGLFAGSSSRSLFTESFGASSSRRPHSPNGDSRYISGIINPPQTVVDLSSLINGDYTQLDDIIASIRNDEAANRPIPVDGDDSASTSSEPDAEDAVEHGGSAVDRPMPNGIADPRRREIPDSSRFTNRHPTEHELRAQHQAISGNTQRLGLERRRRVQARRQLHERWKRRQFYLDEEEGGLPPKGWNNNEDVLINLDGVAGPSKPMPEVRSHRSRSSSKVRFAEDTDDFDVRSNPSTSSRSVPERWGGIEIPDAERDAGKEILYQVTQQAFNELLDEIFKMKEDLAIRCAETKDDREKYRPLFEHIDLDQPDTPPSIEVDTGRPRKNSHSIEESSLEDLLSTSGYTVEADPGQNESDANPSTSHNHTDDSDQPHDDVGDDHNWTERSSTLSTSLVADANGYLDPTMPQNRPNAVVPGLAYNSLSFGEPEEQVAGKEKHKEEGQARSRNALKDNGERSTKQEKGTEGEDKKEPPSPATLEEWKRLDLAEEEARERGGWGKLSYAEFEQIYREHEFQDSNRNRLDYLGSWIDFCIP